MSRITDPEPPPVASAGTDIVDLVKQDLDERRRVGVNTYGVPLRAFNGRRPLRDAYAELLDLVQYLRQEIVEREELANMMDTMAAVIMSSSCTAGYEEELSLIGRAQGLRVAARMTRGEHIKDVTE